jgi:type IV secretion system protein TrbG
MPPAVQTVSPDKPLTKKEAIGVTVAQRWIQKFQMPHLDADGVEHFVSGKGQVFVVTAVDHLTDIALAPGETILPPLHVGDSSSWKFHPAMSRNGGKPVSHVLVKPIDAGLSTNMIIETNMRTISVALTSRQRDYMPLVSLDLPEDDDTDFTTYGAKLNGGAATDAAQPASACDQVPVVPPSQFAIEGDKASWHPTQVYQVATSVGIKTCVDFPSDIGSTSLPALLALADDGGWFSGPTKTVVNVRFVNRRFIVDEALSRFVLVDGVGSSQRSVEITRKGL